MEIEPYQARPPALPEPAGAPGYDPVGAILEDEPVPLAHYWWVLRRHRWRILGFVFVSVAAELIYTLQQTPVYQSTAILEIDNQAQMLEIGQAGVRFDYRNWDMVLESQLQLLDSSEIARQVIQELQLDRHPDFNPALKKGAPPSRAWGPAGDPPAPATLPGLAVRRRPDTYLLEVSYRSTNPDLAAAIANAAARAFVQHGFLSQYQNTAELTRWLNRQLEEIKAKLERSQQALRNFEREHKVVNPEDRSNILNQQLQTLQSEMSRAQAEKLRKQAAWQAAAAGDFDAIAVSEQGAPLLRLAERVEALEAQLADASAQYGPNHPVYRRISGELARATQSLDSVKRRIVARMEADYKQSVARETALAEAVANLKEEVDRLGVRLAEYNLLKREVDSQTKIYEQLLQKVNEASINASIKATNLRLASPAARPDKPVSPVMRTNLLLALLFSTALAVGVALGADYLDRTLRSGEQVEQLLRLPVLATLPRVTGKKAPAALLSANGGGEEGRAVARSAVPFVEALGMLRTSVLLSGPTGDRKMLLVASAAPAEGKSTIASGLSLALSQQLENGSRVLLVDSDLRRPNVHNIFGLPNRQGLSTILEGQSELPESIQTCRACPNLDILPAGPSPRHASELLTMHMAKFLEETRLRYAYVVIDSAPLLVCADSTILSALADGVLLVARAGETPRDAVAAALRQLRRVRANVLGLVLNQVRLPEVHGYGRYYGRYYGSYYGGSTAPAQDEI